MLLGFAKKLLDYFDTAYLRIIIRSDLHGDNLLESNFMSLIITLYVRIKAASAQVIRA